MRFAQAPAPDVLVGVVVSVGLCGAPPELGGAETFVPVTLVSETVVGVTVVVTGGPYDVVAVSFGLAGPCSEVLHPAMVSAAALSSTAAAVVRITVVRTVAFPFNRLNRHSSTIIQSCQE